MPLITKEHAKKIVRKLKGKVQKRENRSHDFVTVYEGETAIATFGLRRGSRRDLGHDFIPASLHIRPHQALDLANCPLSRKEWIRILEEKGLI